MDITVTMVEALVGALVGALLTLEAWRWWVLRWWRISEAVDLLRSIDASLKCLPAVQEARAQAAPPDRVRSGG